MNSPAAPPAPASSSARARTSSPACRTVRAAHLHQPAVAADHADPEVLADVEVADRAPVGPRPGLDEVAVQALRLVAEPHAQRPRLGLGDPHRDLQQARDRRHQPALHDDRHEHHDEDDVVDPRPRRPSPRPARRCRAGSARRPSARRTARSSARRGAAPPAAARARRAAAGRRGPAARPGRARSTRARRANTDDRLDRQAEHHERHDLGDGGQRAGEALDLALVRRAGVADDDAGEEHGEEARALERGRRRRRAAARTRSVCTGYSASLGSGTRRITCSSSQPPARPTTAPTPICSAKCPNPLPTADQPPPAGTEHAHHQRDAHRVVGARTRPRAASPTGR